MGRLSILNSNSDHSTVKSNKSSKKKSRELFLRRLERVRSQPENQRCADCHASNPSWVSLLAPPSRSHGDQSMGVFCCHKCCSYHFLLGRDVCLVKNPKKVDEWTDEEIRVLEASGNQIASSIYEGNLNSARPSPDDHQAQEQFIRDKYMMLEFFCVKSHMNHLSSPPIKVTSSGKTKKNKKPKSISKNARTNSNESSLSRSSSHTCSTYVMEDFSSSELGYNHSSELQMSCSEIALRKIPTEDEEDQDDKYASMNRSEPAAHSPVPPRQARRASLAATTNGSTRSVNTASSLQRACAATVDPNRSPVPIRSTRTTRRGSMGGSSRLAPSTRRERRVTLAAAAATTTTPPSTRRSSTLRSGRRSSLSSSSHGTSGSSRRKTMTSQSEHGRSSIRKSSSLDLDHGKSLNGNSNHSDSKSTRNGGKWAKMSASATTTRTRTLPQATPSSKLRRASIANLYKAGGEAATSSKKPATNLLQLQQQAEERTSKAKETVADAQHVQEETKASKKDTSKEESSRKKKKKKESSSKKTKDLDDIPELVELPSEDNASTSTPPSKKKEEHQCTTTTAAQVPSDEDLEKMVLAKMSQLTNLMVSITKPKEEEPKQAKEEPAEEDDDDASWEFCATRGHFVNKAKTTKAPVVEVCVPDREEKKDRRRKESDKSRRSSKRSSLIKELSMKDSSSRRDGSSRRSSLSKELSKTAMKDGSSRRDIHKSESRSSLSRELSKTAMKDSSSRRDIFKSDSKDHMRDSSRRRSTRRASISTPSEDKKDLDRSKRSSRRSSTSSSKRPSSLKLSLSAARANE